LRTRPFANEPGQPLSGGIVAHATGSVYLPLCDSLFEGRGGMLPGE
jgi:hypothetical protein